MEFCVPYANLCTKFDMKSGHSLFLQKETSYLQTVIPHSFV